MAVCGHGNGGSASASVYVRVHAHISNYWVQVGEYVDWESTGEYFGYVFTISSDFKTVAVGTGDNGISSRYVQVHAYIVNDWVQVGEDIDGEIAHDNLGIEFDISSDGKTFSVGAYKSYESGCYYVYV